jgi:hypothetical protein
MYADLLRKVVGLQISRPALLQKCRCLRLAQKRPNEGSTFHRPDSIRFVGYEAFRSPAQSPVLKK